MNTSPVLPKRAKTELQPLPPTRISTFLPRHVVLAVALLAALAVLTVPRATAKSCAHHCRAKVAVVTIGLSLPTGIQIDRKGNVYVADKDSRIRKFTPSGRLIASWGHAGADPGALNVPNLFARDIHGNLYVPDTLNGRIEKFSSKGALLANWGSPGATAGQFARPLSVAVDAAGEVYVADASNNRIQKLAPSGNPISQWGAGIAVHHPAGLALDVRGFLYVGDAGNNRIDRITPNGTMTGWGRNADVGRPTGVAVDSNGNVYFADRGNDRVVKLSPTGTMLAAWGSSGAGLNQFSFRAQNHMNGIALDGKGDIWISDTSNNRVKELSPKGQVIAIWK